MTIAGAALPVAGQLPEDLRWIVDVHTQDVSPHHADYESQMNRLLSDLGYRWWRPWALLAGILVVVGLVVVRCGSEDGGSAASTAATAVTSSPSSTSSSSTTTTSTNESTTAAASTTEAPATTPMTSPTTAARTDPTLAPATTAPQCTVPTLIGREVTELIAELVPPCFEPFPQVATDGHYRYIVVGATDAPGSQVPEGKPIPLTIEFDATALSFPVGLPPAVGPAGNPLCSGGRYTIPEQKWSGTNVADVKFKVTPPLPGTLPLASRATTTVGIGTFGGKTPSLIVDCSSSNSVTFVLELTAIGKPHIDGRSADEVSKTLSVKIDPPPVFQG